MASRFVWTGLVPAVRSGIVVAFIMFLGVDSLAYSDRVIVESVNDYTTCQTSNLPYSITNGDQFWQSLTGAPGAFRLGQRWINWSVFDTDFVDPDTGHAGADHMYWDSPGAAISYFTGHGIDPLEDKLNQCIVDGHCTTWPGGKCIHYPSGARCYYVDWRSIVTCSPSNQHGGLAMYSSGGEPWGEHQYGNWAGAGTNGGTNMVVLDLSHGVKPELWFQQLNAIFAGIHLAATIMPVWGDTNNVPDRGWRFADFYRVNPNSSVGVAWGDTLHSVANGGPCPDDNGNTVGGGHGINGCGCNFVFAMHEWGGWTHSYVYDQSWEHLRDDAYDGYLRTWYTWRAVCNYDVSLYPWHPW